jgi:hypothetical protein
MNIKLALISIATFLGITGVSFAQSLGIGNPFASLGIDFYGFFLPWIFTFAIVFGLLSKLGLFQQRQINMALAFVIAFFVTAVGGLQLATFFTSLFGGTAMFLAGILVILLFATMIGVDLKSKYSTAALVVVVLIGVGLFLASSGSFIAVNVIGPDLAGIVFWLVVIAAAIYFVTKEGGGEAPKKG